jgi:hypothetical protein
VVDKLHSTDAYFVSQDGAQHRSLLQVVSIRATLPIHHSELPLIRAIQLIPVTSQVDIAHSTDAFLYITQDKSHTGDAYRYSFKKYHGTDGISFIFRINRI